jgi:hypothetical protein
VTMSSQTKATLDPKAGKLISYPDAPYPFLKSPQS